MAGIDVAHPSTMLRVTLLVTTQVEIHLYDLAQDRGRIMMFLSRFIRVR